MADILKHVMKYIPLFAGVIFITNISSVVILLYVTGRQGIGRQPQTGSCAIEKDLFCFEI